MTMDEFPHVTDAERDHFQRLQAIEDAIAYRAARLAAPCSDCGQSRCDDHATDADLITVYRWSCSRSSDEGATHVSPLRSECDFRSVYRELCRSVIARGPTSLKAPEACGGNPWLGDRS
jgi:hypothetical protein